VKKLFLFVALISLSNIYYFSIRPNATLKGKMPNEGLKEKLNVPVEKSLNQKNCKL
jgi:hypothetical protein